MTLVITALAAVIFTALYFATPRLGNTIHAGIAALMFWGASLMWCVDGFACLAEGEPFIELSDAAAMTDDALLGICVVVLGLFVWGIANIVKRQRLQQS